MAISVLNVIGDIIVLSLHILFPEAVILSKEQILRASQVYKNIGNQPHQIGLDVINDYLLQVKKLLEDITDS